jgi:mycofactocin system transcriptional regulator
VPEATPKGPPRAGPGRPRATSARTLELIALQLFTERGYDATTVDLIATTAGTSRRTFFRYFESKAAVLWRAFDSEIEALREALARTAADLPLMAAVRQAVVGVNHYRAEDVAELRTRMALIGSVPDLIASAAVHYDAWERAVADFVAARRSLPPDSLYPLVVGRATLAACRAAYEHWTARADADLTTYLDAALSALATGFADDSSAGNPAS